MAAAAFDGEPRWRLARAREGRGKSRPTQMYQSRRLPRQRRRLVPPEQPELCGIGRSHGGSCEDGGGLAEAGTHVPIMFARCRVLFRAFGRSPGDRASWRTIMPARSPGGGRRGGRPSKTWAYGGPGPCPRLPTSVVLPHPRGALWAETAIAGPFEPEPGHAGVGTEKVRSNPPRRRQTPARRPA
jgi:hypothetical protein